MGTSGIYTQDDLNKMRERIMSRMEQRPALEEISQKIISNTNAQGEGSIYNIFNEDALEKLAASTWDRTWGRFISFGTISAGFLRIFILLRILKLIIDTIIHGYALHDAFGWSIH